MKLLLLLLLPLPNPLGTWVRGILQTDRERGAKVLEPDQGDRSFRPPHTFSPWPPGIDRIAFGSGP